MVSGCIFDIKRYAIHDGPGIRTTVFFKGCPLHCWWCHNPESQSVGAVSMVKINKLDGREFKDEVPVGHTVTVEQLLDEIRKDAVFYEESDGGVTFSGGEPLMQPAFLAASLKMAKTYGFHTCVDTAGVSREMISDKIITYSDLFLYDIKTADRGIFDRYIGNGFDRVWENLARITTAGKEVIIRIPVIPGINDSEKSGKEIVQRLSQFPTLSNVSFLPYHHVGCDKYGRLGMTYKMKDTAPLSEEGLKPLKELFIREGYHIS